MAEDVRQGLREDGMSDCRSFGSNHYPSSQLRKISMGVMVDSLAKRKSVATKEYEPKLTDTERIKPSTAVSTKGKNKGEVFTTAKGKQTEVPEQVKSPWVTPGSFHQKALAPETAFFPGEASNSRQKKGNALKDVPLTSVHFFPNKTMNVENVGSHQNEFDDLSYKMKGEKEINSQKVEEFNFTNAVGNSQKVGLEGKADKSQNAQTETLKMKLQELLGTVSSPKGLQLSSQYHEVTANNLKPEVTANHVEDTVLKPGQLSDTIETDSDNPDKTIKRPLTRSLTRKRAPTKVPPDKTKVGLSSKQKHQGSIFSFGEDRSTKLNGAVNSCLWSRKRKIQKRSSKIEPRKISFHQEDNAEEIQQTAYRSETPLPAEKTSSLGKKTGSYPGSFSKKRRENFEKIQEKKYFHSPVSSEKNQQVDFDNSVSPEKGDQQEDFGDISFRNVAHAKDDSEGQDKLSFHSPVPSEKIWQVNLDNPTSPGKGEQEDSGNISFRNAAYAEDDFQSPTFGFKTPISIPSPRPTPKTVETEQGDCSPLPSERGFSIGNIRSFKNFQTSRPVCSKSNTPSESPDNAEMKPSSSRRNPILTKKKVDAINMHSGASSEEKWSKSLEKGSPIINRYNCHKENVISPETVIAEKSNFLHCPIKRLRNREDVRLREFSPTASSPKGAAIGESYWFQESSEQDQEDELTRAVTLFALALENFKRKMDSATRKKTSGILKSISEEIKLLLLNAESQIESDVGKLTSFGKIKRKRLETNFQEKQEQLKRILEKFNEDIHNRLLDCRSTIEGMEADQNELKGIMKKQRASHQKLLVHVEAAVEIQINNAERRITAVHESARGKMLQLKHVIAECLKDSI